MDRTSWHQRTLLPSMYTGKRLSIPDEKKRWEGLLSFRRSRLDYLRDLKNVDRWEIRILRFDRIDICQSRVRSS